MNILQHLKESDPVISNFINSEKNINQRIICKLKFINVLINLKDSCYLVIEP